MQDEAARPACQSSSLGFAAKYAAQLMNDMLIPIPDNLWELEKRLKSGRFETEIKNKNGWVELSLRNPTLLVVGFQTKTIVLNPTYLLLEQLKPWANSISLMLQFSRYNQAAEIIKICKVG